MKSSMCLGSLAAVGILCAASNAADWITAPSHYTHDPQTGQRVDQYTPIGPFYTFARSDYLQSGYRHTRSTIQAGLSVDHMHIVEEWGRPVRPYGEWRFPFRPYSVPYPMWGPPYAGLWEGLGADQGGPAGRWGDADPYGRQQPPPYQDDTYAPFRSQLPNAQRSRGPRHPVPEHGP
ncbi:MAG: hypothetical protein ACYC0X_06415 [Pirellulaceae bacterium]